MANLQLKVFSCHTTASVSEAICTTLVFLLRLLHPISRLDSVISTSSPKTACCLNLFNTFKIPKSCSCEGSLTICIFPVKRRIGYCSNSSSLSRSLNDSGPSPKLDLVFCSSPVACDFIHRRCSFPRVMNFLCASFLPH